MYFFRFLSQVKIEKKNEISNFKDNKKYLTIKFTFLETEISKIQSVKKNDHGPVVKFVLVLGAEVTF